MPQRITGQVSISRWFRRFMEQGESLYGHIEHIGAIVRTVAI